MLGAIIGDIVGSRFEWHNIKTKKFDFFTDDCFFTDDSVMSLALAQAIMDWDDEGRPSYDRLSELSAKYMRSIGLCYPHAGYGGHFRLWLADESMGPYNSCGNGSAMRVSAVGFAARTLEECIEMSRAVTQVTHDHPDGIMGAESTAVQIFMARGGATLDELRKYEVEHYYPIGTTLAKLRRVYSWSSICNGTCQAAFLSLYEAKDYEDAIRNSMSLGGDSDTIGAICGGIAEAVFKIPEEIREKGLSYLDERLRKIYDSFYDRYLK